VRRKKFHLFVLKIEVETTGIDGRRGEKRRMEVYIDFSLIPNVYALGLLPGCLLRILTKC